MYSGETEENRETTQHNWSSDQYLQYLCHKYRDYRLVGAWGSVVVKALRY